MQGQHGPIVGRNEYFQAEAATSAANHGTVPPRG